MPPKPLSWPGFFPIVECFREEDCAGTGIPEADIAPSTSSRGVLGAERFLFAFNGVAVSFWEVIPPLLWYSSGGHVPQDLLEKDQRSHKNGRRDGTPLL